MQCGPYLGVAKVLRLYWVAVKELRFNYHTEYIYRDIYIFTVNNRVSPTQ